MEPNKKVDPPQARNNTSLFAKLEKEGKEIVIFQGYKYIFKDKNTLIPQCGLIAKKKDFTKWNEKKNLYSNLNMNRFPAYRDALIYLQGDLELEEEIPQPEDEKVKELEAEIKKYKKIIADAKKAEAKRKAAKKKAAAKKGA